MQQQTFDAATIHRAELDREIDAIRTERILAGSTGESLLGRARTRTGRALIAAGTALAGPDRSTSRHSTSVGRAGI